jgi:acyl-CoA thioesterase-1
MIAAGIDRASRALARWLRMPRRMVLALPLALVCALALPAAAACGEPLRVLVFGDSLSAAYGVPQGKGWVDLLAQRLRAGEREASVINASVSGETTQGGVTRIEDALTRHAPNVLVLELGGNDALRGLPLARTKDNLARMIAAARAHGARVLLLGMRIPPNYGPEYTRGFEDLFRELHEELGVAWIPFLLEGVALDESLMQGDGIHPTATAQSRLLDNVWPALEPLLQCSG